MYGWRKKGAPAPFDKRINADGCAVDGIFLKQNFDRFCTPPSVFSVWGAIGEYGKENTFVYKRAKWFFSGDESSVSNSYGIKLTMVALHSFVLNNGIVESSLPIRMPPMRSTMWRSEEGKEMSPMDEINRKICSKKGNYMQYLQHYFGVFYLFLLSLLAHQVGPFSVLIPASIARCNCRVYSSAIKIDATNEKKRARNGDAGNRIIIHLKSLLSLLEWFWCKVWWEYLGYSVANARPTHTFGSEYALKTASETVKLPNQ